MPFKGPDQFAGSNFPEFEGSISTARKYIEAIGLKGRGENPVFMPFKGSDQFAGGNFPDYDGVLKTT